MSFPSLIAHNGVTHQKSSPEPKITPSITETQTNQKPKEAQTVLPEGNSLPKQQPVETLETNFNAENKSEALTTTEIPITSDLATATLFPGFGESIFTLLIASPFLLFGFKKWLQR